MMTQTTMNSTAVPGAEREPGSRRRGGDTRPLVDGSSGLATAPVLAATADEGGLRAPATWRAVYSIVERSQKKHWLRVGVAFVNRDGSLNVRLDAVPINGQLHIRESRDSRDAGGASTSEPDGRWRD